MKTWHWLLIGGVAIIGVYLFFSSRQEGVSIGGVKLTDNNSAGAPPLPNVVPSNPANATLLAFTIRNRVDSMIPLFGRPGT